MSFVVAKVGGSLFDLPDFKNRLQAWLRSQDSHRILLVPGGGRLVDAIREFDRLHQLGDEASHWLAIAAMHVNAIMLSSIINDSVVRNVNEAENVWGREEIAIFDPGPFCHDNSDLPHSWETTSDSIAARVAVMWGASKLVLLKSATPPNSVDDWAASGYCDPWLTRVLAGSKVVLSAVNLREA